MAETKTETEKKTWRDEAQSVRLYNGTAASCVTVIKDSGKRIEYFMVARDPAELQEIMSAMGFKDTSELRSFGVTLITP